MAVAGLALFGACSTEGGDRDGDDVTSDVGAGEDDRGPGEDVPLGGDDPTLADDSIDVGDDEGTLTADLQITAGVDGNTDERGQALLECSPNEAVGVLWLEGDAAEAACEALEDPTLLAALDPPEDHEGCAEAYGGPDVATVVGTVEGIQVDAVVHRADGCAIERWDVLASLLPEPVDS